MACRGVSTSGVPRARATDWSVGTFEGGIRRQRRKNNKNEEREDLTYSRHVWRGASPTTLVAAPARTPSHRLTPGQSSKTPTLPSTVTRRRLPSPTERRAIVDRWLRGSETPFSVSFYPLFAFFLVASTCASPLSGWVERYLASRCSSLKSDPSTARPLRRCSLKNCSLNGLISASGKKDRRGFFIRKDCLMKWRWTKVWIFCDYEWRWLLHQ